MMIVLGITVALIILLITTLVILRRREKCASCTPKETLISKSKAPESVKPQQETKTADKSIVNDEPTAMNPKISAAKVIAPQAKAAVAPAENSSSVLPQDSILRRHYFTHLCAMIEALVPPRPTESVLCRHYDMMIVTKIAQCLSDKKALEQLFYDHEQLNA